MRNLVCTFLSFGIIVTAGNTAVYAEAFDSKGRFIVAQSEKSVGEAEGVIKGIDTTERKLQIMHGPISGSLQMPGMTMVFRVAPNIDLSGLAKGAKVKFTVTRDEKGLYVIEQLKRED